jgi:hypothetical protein
MQISLVAEHPQQHPDTAQGIPEFVKLAFIRRDPPRLGGHG